MKRICTLLLTCAAVAGLMASSAVAKKPEKVTLDTTGTLRAGSMAPTLSVLKTYLDDVNAAAAALTAQALDIESARAFSAALLALAEGAPGICHLRGIKIFDPTTDCPSDPPDVVDSTGAPVSGGTDTDSDGICDADDRLIAPGGIQVDGDDNGVCDATVPGGDTDSDGLCDAMDFRVVGPGGGDVCDDYDDELLERVAAGMVVLEVAASENAYALMKLEVGLTTNGLESFAAFQHAEALLRYADGVSKTSPPM